MYHQTQTEIQNSCKIVLTNLNSGDMLCYSFAFIKGIIQLRCNKSQEYTRNNAADIITVCNGNADDTASETVWPVVSSKFKCLVNLHRGVNEVTFKYLDAQYICVLEFKPRRTAYRVMPVYIICNGHDGRFQAPDKEENTVPSACKRIAVGAKMIQSLVAEKLNEAGLGRKTFQLENDLNSQAAECTVFHSHLHVKAARSMKPGQLWEYFGRELMSSSLGNTDRKFLAFLSCTQYLACKEKPNSHEEMLARCEGHVALGGGGLAIFGTACLHTWPQDVKEIIPRFSDTTAVDGRYFMDDSCYRGTYGGCFATTLGSVCHELGHIFDLGHTETGIMGRGFDNVNLVFTFQAGHNDNAARDCCRNSARANKNDNIHNATVQFTKVLNLSYSISNCPKPQNRNGKLTKLSKNTECVVASTEKSREKSSQDFLDSDATHWGTSCAMLLAFHRWFNTEVPQNGFVKISFDETRNEVSSAAGLCAVELRDDTGLVLNSWQFSEVPLTTTFKIPTVMLTQLVTLLLAQDCTGNILKKHLDPRGHHIYT